MLGQSTNCVGIYPTSRSFLKIAFLKSTKKELKKWLCCCIVKQKKQNKNKKRNNKFTPSGTTFGVFWVDHSDFCSMKKKINKNKKMLCQFCSMVVWTYGRYQINLWRTKSWGTSCGQRDITSWVTVAKVANQKLVK